MRLKDQGQFELVRLYFIDCDSLFKENDGNARALNSNLHF